MREYDDAVEIAFQPPLPSNTRRRHLVTHDESTFNANDSASFSWKKEGTEWLKPKSKGKGITMGWMANTDIQPATTLRAVIDYVAKYCSKAEKASFAYSELQAQVLPNVSSRNPVLSFTSKMLNKLVGERDWSAQEICHIILGKGLYHSSRKVITFDCRPEKEQRHVVELGDNEVQERKSNVQRYKERCQGRTGDA